MSGNGAKKKFVNLFAAIFQFLQDEDTNKCKGTFFSARARMTIRGKTCLDYPQSDR